MLLILLHRLRNTSLILRNIDFNVKTIKNIEFSKMEKILKQGEVTIMKESNKYHKKFRENI